MLAYSVLGVSDVAARVPAAIDATLLVIAVYLFFRRFRRGVEVDAALITASCAGMIGYAHAASMDMALAAAFSIGMLAWWAWRESGRRIYLALFYFCMALGMLAKGPVAPFLAAACHCALRCHCARTAPGRENGMAAGHSPVLRDRVAVVSRGADAESAILSRIHSAAQPGAFLERFVSPSPAVLVLPSGHGHCARALDGFCDRGFRGIGARLVGGTQIRLRSRARSRIAVRPVCLLLAGCAGCVLFDLAVEASRVHSSGDSGRRHSAGGLPAAASRARARASGVRLEGTGW